MSMLCSTTDVVSVVYWPFLVKILTLNVFICNALLHLIKFCLCLSSGWLVGFNAISTFVGYLMPNPFLYK